MNTTNEMNTLPPTLTRPLGRSLILMASLTLIVSCDDKPRAPSEAVKDALDVRPHEKLKDAGEDIKDAATDLTK